MLNTPYERGWRSAVLGVPLPEQSSRAFQNGYRDAIIHGYGKAPPAPRPCIPPPAGKKPTDRTIRAWLKGLFTNE